MKVLGKIEGPQDAVNKEYVDSLLEPGGGGEQPEDGYATKEEVIDDEEVVAVALHNHEDRIAGLEKSIPSTYAKIELLNATKEELIKLILENEEVAAAALTDLNNRIRAIITRLNSAGL